MAKKKKKAASNTLEIQNAAKTMLANIRFASVDSPMQSIVITSSVPNEGKTTTTIELAKAIASSGNSVLLVEADMRRRSAASALGVRASHGAYAVMANQVTLQQAVVSAGVPNFYFLDTEPNIPNPADILSSRAYVRLVDEACDAYDYVLFDTPPVGTFVDAAILSRLVDGVVLVVKIGGAKRDEIVAAYDQLNKAEAHIIGACATFCEGTGSEYYYAYYNKDNQRVDPEKEARRAKKKGGSTPPLATPSIPRGANKSVPARGVKPGGTGSSTAVPAHNQVPKQAKQAEPQQNISNSQSWKRSAVQAGVQQARRSNTPRVDRSQRKH